MQNKTDQVITAEPLSEPAHQALRERLSEWQDGELSAQEARAMEAHVAGCEGCRAEVAALQRTLAALSALRHNDQGPHDLVSGVVDRVRRRSRGRFFGADTRKQRRLEWISAVTLAVLVLLYAVLRLANPTLLELR